jgi:hypothetical protein
MDQTFMQDICKPLWLKVIDISLRTNHPQRKILEKSRTASGQEFRSQTTVNLASIKTVKIEFWFCPSNVENAFSMERIIKAKLQEIKLKNTTVKIKFWMKTRL